MGVFFVQNAQEVIIEELAALSQSKPSKGKGRDFRFV